MPRKVRELIAELGSNGFIELRSAGKGTHRKFKHPEFIGAVTVSGMAGEDAKKYRERLVQHAVSQVTQ